MAALMIVWKNHNHKPLVLNFNSEAERDCSYNLLGPAIVNKLCHNAGGQILINTEEILYVSKV